MRNCAIYSISASNFPVLFMDELNHCLSFELPSMTPIQLARLANPILFLCQISQLLPLAQPNALNSTCFFFNKLSHFTQNYVHQSTLLFKLHPSIFWLHLEWRLSIWAFLSQFARNDHFFVFLEQCETAFNYIWNHLRIVNCPERPRNTRIIHQFRPILRLFLGKQQ